MERIDSRSIQNKEPVVCSAVAFKDLSECPMNIKNIGWTLGNDCPYRCKHCYSMSAREKGMDLSREIADRVVEQLAINGIETVNLGGNEPLFTNGLDPKLTLLPYIIDSLTDKGIKVGLTTSGISAVHLERDHLSAFMKLNDIDVSLDSPFEQEHNENRGAYLYKQALKVLDLCEKHGIDHSIIMCAMNWNFTDRHIRELVKIAERSNANVRINTLKPVEAKHMETALPAEQFYTGFSLLMSLASPVDLGEPPLAAVTGYENAKGCACGRTSFRIHSITPDGKIPVSPCVYMHDYKVGDLATQDLYDIVRTIQFKTFRQRNANPQVIPGCEGCGSLEKCRGGCAARSYLYHKHATGRKDLFVKDPYCPKDIDPDRGDFPQNPQIENSTTLVHQDYLCTCIVKPCTKA